MFVKLQGVKVCWFSYYKDTFNRWIWCNSNIATEAENLQRQLNVLIIYVHKNIILLVAIIYALCERIILYVECKDIFNLCKKFQIMLLVVNLRNQGITRVCSTSSQRLEGKIKEFLNISKGWIWLNKLILKNWWKLEVVNPLQVLVFRRYVKYRVRSIKVAP